MDKQTILRNFLNRNRVINLPVTFDHDGEFQEVFWDSFYDERIILSNGMHVYKAGRQGPVCVFFHGAGHTAMSWAIVASKLKEDVQVICFDARGHGGSDGMSMEDMSSDVLVSDAIQMIHEVFPEEVPPLVFIGHSMGGAIAIRTAIAMEGQVAALIVLDVVEGTAMESLPKMVAILQSRPHSFESPEEAISWSLRTGGYRKKDSARISVPGQLKEVNGEYRWRTDLMVTQPFWSSWFSNMSELFLSVPAPKLLIIADTDRLDTSLTIAQMQGKYQMTIFPNVGHLIQEDDPSRTVETITTFLKRFRLI
eukprot:TRINITY_DN7871_c0_g1_i1.p1 TRINITY_DN7871_c0_g1~~TRINITY_DN7871_c0_g1_i1.p1  ORF type:complete len:322 (-),score=52.07 TRINITY_DN7871_c0_g1_i1:34-960(-)